MASTLGEINPIRYRGYYYDTETGFYYLNSRYYDPVVGRFISPDSTDFLGITGTTLSLNLFAYCENNAVNNVDPSGYWLIDIEITDKLINGMNFVLTCFAVVVSGIFVAKAGKAALNVFKWISKKSFKNKLNNIMYKCATIIFNSLYNIIYYFSDEVPDSFKKISVAAISSGLIDLIDFSPAKIILNIIDSIDGDKKTGHIRW